MAKNGEETINKKKLYYSGASNSRYASLLLSTRTKQAINLFKIIDNKMSKCKIFKHSMA